VGVGHACQRDAGAGLLADRGYFSERYAGPLAHHESLAKALKGLDDRHLLVQYVLPAAHVLIDPGGSTVFVVKSQLGDIHYADGRWNHHHKGKFFRQLAGQENLGAPDLESQRQVERLERWLEQNVPGLEVPMRAAIVFVHPKANLDAQDSPVPAFYGKKSGPAAWARRPQATAGRGLPPLVQQSKARPDPSTTPRPATSHGPQWARDWRAEHLDAAVNPGSAPAI